MVIFTIYSRTNFQLSLHVSRCVFSSFFSIKSSGDLLNDDDSLDSFFYPPLNRGMSNQKKKRREKNREDNKAKVCDRMWLSRKKMISCNFCGKICSWLFNFSSWLDNICELFAFGSFKDYYRDVCFKEIRKQSLTWLLEVSKKKKNLLQFCNKIVSKLWKLFGKVLEAFKISFCFSFHNVSQELPLPFEKINSIKLEHKFEHVHVWSQV